MTTRKYSSRSQQTSLSAAVTSGALVIPVVNALTLMGGASVTSGQTFVVVIDPDTALEEIVEVTAVSSNNLTVTRAVDMSGAAAQDHSSGAVIRHMIIGRDLREANLHIEASAAYNDGTSTHAVHGLGSSDGSVVGTTATQTLTNKTLTSPVLTGTLENDASITFEGATADAYETTLTVVDPTADRTITLPNTSGTVVLKDSVDTLTNKTLTSPTISGSPVITGLSSAGMSASSAAPKDYVDSILGSATAASTSATSAAASATAASTSASSAATSASLAATSASSASTSQTAAATSATSAAASATAAATSATSAAASATAAASSATTAAASVASISTYAGNALTSANSAATSAASAAASTSAAATSASSAATSATAAATSATSAAASATAASTSATSAAASATAAATSAASAAAAMTNAVDKTLIDAKGDLFVGSAADTVARLGIGTDGYLLTAASTATNGVTWAAAPVSLPAQSTHNGQYLTTDGSAASWATVPVPVAQTTEPSSPTDGLIWVDTDGTAPTTVVTRWSKAPANGTTSLSGTDDGTTVLAYTPGYEEVFLNGVLLSRANDYTATTGTSVVLTTATVAGDLVEIICPLQVAYTDAITTTAANAAYVPKTLTTTTGDIIYASAANTPARLGIGSTDQVLKVSGGVPAWGAGGMTLINRTTFTAVANTSTTFDGVFSSTYRTYMIVIEDIIGSAAVNGYFQWRVGASTQSGANYDYYNYNQNSTPTSGSLGGSGQTQYVLFPLGTARNSGYSYSVMNTTTVADVSNRPSLLAQTFASSYYGTGGMVYKTDIIPTGFILSAASGTITGTVSVYGLAKA